MTRIVVLVPSRGRPARALETFDSFRDTISLLTTRIVFGVDHDDPTLPAYLKLPEVRTRRFGWAGDEPLVTILRDGDSGNLTRATNGLWRRFQNAPIIGTVNDDMLFRTPGWDRMVSDSLTEPGIVFGNDLIHGERLPTSPFFSSVIPRTLGWYALPTCEHLYIDDAWREIGLGIGRLQYLPEMVVEHIHPAVGKAAWDEGYERANNRDVVDRDHAAYLAWRNGPDYLADCRNIRRVLRQAA